jgi:class 3 adenylate cyclase
MQALVSLRDKDWEFYSEASARAVLGWSAGEPASRYAALIRESITREVLNAYLVATYQIDVTPLLAEVKSPTLVLHRRQYAALAVDAAKFVAARLPNARLVVLEGESGAPYHGDTDAVLSVIDEFLSEGAEAAEKPPLPSGMTAILFADIADSTALTERLGDAAFRTKARELDGALRSAIRERGGTPVEGKLLGDGVLAVFTSAREAIEAALACGEQGRHAGLPLHLGIHAGDVIREKDPDGRDNVYGGAVNIASRIAGLSAAGEVLVSETVRSLARTSAGVEFEERGEQELKGVGEKVRVWAVVEGSV